MSFATVAETGILEAILENKVTNAVIAALGSGLQAAVTPGSLYISLHTADPGEAGDQTTNEVSWTGYARVAIARADAQWTISSGSASNANTVQFAQRTSAGSTTVTHFGIGTGASGAGNLLGSGPLATAASEVFVVDDSLHADTILAVGDDGTGHGLTDDLEVIFIAVEGASLPSGITEGTRYYVLNAGTDDFEIDDVTPATSALVLGNGSGRFAKVVTQVVQQNNTPSFGAGTLILALD